MKIVFPKELNIVARSLSRTPLMGYAWKKKKKKKKKKNLLKKKIISKEVFY